MLCSPVHQNIVLASGQVAHSTTTQQHTNTHHQLSLPCRDEETLETHSSTRRSHDQLSYREAIQVDWYRANHSIVILKWCVQSDLQLCDIAFLRSILTSLILEVITSGCGTLWVGVVYYDGCGILWVGVANLNIEAVFAMSQYSINVVYHQQHCLLQLTIRQVQTYQLVRVETLQYNTYSPVDSRVCASGTTERYSSPGHFTLVGFNHLKQL